MKLFKVVKRNRDNNRRWPSHYFYIGQLVYQCTAKPKWGSAEYQNGTGGRQFVDASMLCRVKCNKENLRKFAKDKRTLTW